jgi:penicillin-binding protein 1A
LILFAVLLLGLISFVFGMFVAVASDLPSLTRFSLLKNAQSSVLLDDLGHPIGVLSESNRVIVRPEQIPAIVKDAVISIEDKRFRSNSGIDIRGIARAFVQDIIHKGAVQGASTIEQQFIKNALQAQSHRTIFEKLREAALAYQLSHKWTKEKIITAYLDTIYFGNGAYGIEAAAQTYFGRDVNHNGCGTPGHRLCVEEMNAPEAALLAGIIQDPTAYDPVDHPLAATRRRNIVLEQMYQQGYIDKAVYAESLAQSLPAPPDVQTPQQPLVEGVDVGYFTSWVQQQLIERYGAPRVFDGGLKIKTTLDLGLQRAAEQAIDGYLPGPEGPTAALVAIENSTGEVRAMVGGRNYDQTPFNIATEGERQPGSSFKAFDLAAALEDGISPESVWSSHEKVFVVGSPHGPERFVVHNDEGAYTGSNTLTGATAYSDNSIYAEVGLKVGTRRIAHLAHEMGITTPLSINPAMTIGGLKVGVTPLDMAHAYETIAHGGNRVSGSLVSDLQPVGIQEVQAGGEPLPDGRRQDVDQVLVKRILPANVASTETSVLETVLQYGTARSAAIGQFAAGKTGTTSNYGDAWFVGWDSKYTVAVWVGYPNSLVPMTTDFNGSPVLGGTFPALIWHDFVMNAMQVEQSRAAGAGPGSPGEALPLHSQAGSATTGEPVAKPGGASAGTREAGEGGHGGSAGGATNPRGGSSPTGAGGGGSSAEGTGERAPAAPAPSTSQPSAPTGQSEASPPSAGGSAGATGGISPSG